MDDDFAEIAREYGINTDENWYTTDDSGVAFLPLDQAAHSAQYRQLDGWLHDIGDYMRLICMKPTHSQSFQSILLPLSLISSYFTEQT